MKILLKLLFCSMLILFIGNKAYAQTTKTTEQKSSSEKQGSPQTLPQIKETGQFDSSKDEIKYYAPIRYVIVYNEIIAKLDERRVEILVDEKSFSKENLTTIFTHLAKKFPDPLALDITVHTSLTTIQTPEERRMKWDNEDSRFRDIKSLYKSAEFFRHDDGIEVFLYKTSVNPEQYEKVVIVDKPIN